MGVPIKLVIALVIGVMSMGILTQFVDTADRTMLRDMDVDFDFHGNNVRVTVYDAQSQEPLNGPTIVVDYPGGTLAKTLGKDSSSHSFSIPLKEKEVAVVNVRVTHSGYIPWEGEAAVTA